MTIAQIKILPSGVQVSYAGISYLPTQVGEFLGVLLFALRAEAYDVEATVKADWDAALQSARLTTHALEMHAGRVDRSEPDLPADMTLAKLKAVLAHTLLLVPHEYIDEFAEKLMDRLGPNPWCEAQN